MTGVRIVVHEFAAEGFAGGGGDEISQFAYCLDTAAGGDYGGAGGGGGGGGGRRAHDDDDDDDEEEEDEGE
jgi:hypothetical protein